VGGIFKKAIGGVEGRVIRGMRGIRMDDEEEEITRKEVRRAVRKIKEEKLQEGMRYRGRCGNTEGRGWRGTYEKFTRRYGKGRSGLMSGTRV